MIFYLPLHKIAECQKVGHSQLCTRPMSQKMLCVWVGGRSGHGGYLALLSLLKMLYDYCVLFILTHFLQLLRSKY